MALPPLRYLSLTGQSAWQDLLRLLKEDAVSDIRAVGPIGMTATALVIRLLTDTSAMTQMTSDTALIAMRRCVLWPRIVSSKPAVLSGFCEAKAI